MQIEILSKLSIFIVVLCATSVLANAKRPEIVLPYSEVSPFKMAGTNDLSDENYQKMWKGLQRISDSTVIINSRHNCSGVFVSDTGYMLTALHCLDFSMEAMESPLKSASYKLGVQNISITQGDEGFIGRTFKLPSWQLDKSNAIFVFLGKGYMSSLPEPSVLSEASAFEISDLRKSMEDFAIIKLPSVPKGHRCAPLMWERPTSETLVWHSGYPLFHPTTFPLRYNDFNYILKGSEDSKYKAQLSQLVRQLSELRANAIKDNEKWAVDSELPLFLSAGLYFDNLLLADRKTPYFKDNPYINYFSQLFEENTYGISSASIGEGFSGGGAFTTDGNLVGINSMSTGYIRSGDFTYGTAMIRSNHIFDEIRKKLGPEKAAEIFSCSQP